MKYYIILIALIFSLISFAQEVKKDGKTYEVKKGKIYFNGKDVTLDISEEMKASIFKEASAIADKAKAEREAKRLEKANKKAEKALKKAEKARKKAEKELKKKEKLQNNFDKAKKNLEKSTAKYEKLKKKGKLSPVDEKKWLDKLKVLTEKVEKTERKLKDS